MDLSRSWRLFEVAGIEIKAHTSWIFIVLLITWSFWQRFAVVYGHQLVTALWMGIAAAVLFFASLIAHELSHALEAEHRGVEVGGITLFIFGGATETRLDVERPRDEFAVAAIGPFTSFVLAALFGLLATYAGVYQFDMVAQVTGLLGWINLALGGFNLLPGAPLDGGRVLRSGVWRLTGNRQRAVRVASRAGQVIGLGLVGAGLLQIFSVPGGFIGGIWYMFIGWFLAQTAYAELVQHRLMTMLEGRTAGSLAGDLPAPLQAHARAVEAEERLSSSPFDVHPVAEDSRIVGVVHIDELARLPARERGERVIRDLMRPLSEFPSVAADDDARALLQQMSGGRKLVAVTDEHGEVVGIVTPERLSTALRRLARFRGSPRTEQPAIDER